MTLFTILATLLIFIALIFVVPPIFRGKKPPAGKEAQQLVDSIETRLEALKAALKAKKISQKQYDAGRQKLADETLEGIETPGAGANTTQAENGRWAAFLVAIFVPGLAVLLYLQLGSPELAGRIASAPPQMQAAKLDHGKNGLPPVEDMIASLQQKLETNPDDAEGWYLLSRSFNSIKQYEKAAEAMKHAYELNQGENPTITMQYADALAMANGGMVAGEPEKLILQLLEKNPNYPQGLWLAGIAAQQQGLLEKAIGYWQRAVENLSGEPESQAELTRVIQHAQAELGGAQPSPTPVDSNTNTSNTASTAGITVNVALDTRLTDKAQPEDTVFVFAKATSGPPMPLAVQRLTVKQLPTTITLDDSQAMMPSMKMSNFPQVIVGARISRSGNPLPQAGDLEGLSQPMSPVGGITTSIVINQEKS